MNEIQETLEIAGRVLFHKIIDEYKKIISMAYEPKCVVIWEDYYQQLICYVDALPYACNYGIRPETRTILGMNIIRTQLSGTLEVY